MGNDSGEVYDAWKDKQDKMYGPGPRTYPECTCPSEGHAPDCALHGYM